MGSIENAAVAAATLTLNDSLARQREAFARDPQPSRQERQRRLLLLEKLLRDNIDALAAAIDQDFGHRSRDETRLLEIFPSLESIKHARRHLGTWMRDEQRPVSLWFQPGRAKVVLQPLGVVGHHRAVELPALPGRRRRWPPPWPPATARW
ncbi:MAG: hypothetical protein MZW92_16300 [Comamonadaceae bacterium]|nr:hypothetical protein [Comamonadaceae bacterium]